MRTASVARKTNETDIRLSLNLDGTGKSTVESGVGFTGPHAPPCWPATADWTWMSLATGIPRWTTTTAWRTSVLPWETLLPRH